MIPHSDCRHYLPFLKGKRGELRALARVDAGEKDRLTPVIDVPPLAVGPATGLASQTVDDALSGLADQIAKAWGSLERCFVDIGNYDARLRLQDGRHPVQVLFADAREADLAALPVIGMDRDGEYLAAAEEAASRHRQGMGVRLRRRDLRDLPALRQDLPRLVQVVGLRPDQVDLFLDFGELRVSEVAVLGAEADAALRDLPHLDEWRSLTLCSGAFPDRLSAVVEPGKTKELPRRDWTLWRSLMNQADPVPRLPAFADYGVTSASWLAGFDPRTMDMAARIVYTLEDSWLVARGRSLKKGYEQYRDLARTVQARWLGAKHCWSEDYIADCVRGTGGTGSPESWISVATRHHLKVVDSQLASLPEPEAAS